MALPSHVAAWLPLEARRLRPAQPPMRGAFLWVGLKERQAGERAAFGVPVLFAVVDSVLAWSHLIQSLGCERPAMRRHYSFGSALNGVAANPRKLAAMSPRRASRSKWAGKGRLEKSPLSLR
jgi:hypothetical protein